MQRCLGAIAVIGLIAALPIFAADANDELKKFEGVWRVVRAEKEGQVVPPEAVKMMKVTIKAGKIAIVTGKEEDLATLKVDPTKKPAEIDFVPADDPKSTAKGIYVFEKDMLKICWSNVGGERPKDFASKAESTVRLIVLMKEK